MNKKYTVLDLFCGCGGLSRGFIDAGFSVKLGVDFDDKATADIHFNPNNSVYAVEGITSPDGRVLGKMGHSERIGEGLYKNVEGSYDMGLFRSAVKYFK